MHSYQGKLVETKTRTYAQLEENSNLISICFFLAGLSPRTKTFSAGCPCITFGNTDIRKFYH
ncbi:hypothetical protein EHQ95_13330 [Leptospira vanthielii]|uniref:Uncharacterized protein n=1 Tax=Leptospira vanthielii TaxID=293085 RepID=A0ABY2NNK1_9LEPT|nr:hypothetical protein EHQ95_13330 [Leptospira vanthielii]